MNFRNKDEQFLKGLFEGTLFQKLSTLKPSKKMTILKEIIRQEIC
jgi:hypothetical protein